jgi:hypothetical protein
MATPTFGADIDIVLARKAKREKVSVEDLLWGHSVRDMVRQEVFAETGKMLDAKSIPADVMAAIAAEDAK